MYKVIIAPEADKDIEKLSGKKKRQVRDAIVRVAENAEIGKRLAGDLKNYRSCRSGDYRIIYTVVEDRITVVVVAFGHRKDVYERFYRKRISLDKLMLDEKKKGYRKRKKKQ